MPYLPHGAAGRTEEVRTETCRCAVRRYGTREPRVFILLLLLVLFLLLLLLLYFFLVIEIVFPSKAQQMGRNPARRFQRVKSSPGGKKRS